MQKNNNQKIGKIIKLVLVVCMIIAIPIVGVIPFLLKHNISMLNTMLIIYPNGILMVGITWEFIKLFKSLEENNPFNRDNVKILKAAGTISFIMSGLWLADLFRDSVQDAMKEDLLFQYQRLKPMKTIELPSSKNNLHADLIALHYAVELGMNVGKSEEEIKLELYANIDSLPLSKKDKENRKARIRLLLSRLKEEAVSKWDLYDKIKEAIEAAPPVEDLP